MKEAKSPLMGTIKFGSLNEHKSCVCFKFFPPQVTKHKNNYGFTTVDLVKMNDRCDEALREIFHMSYVWGDHDPMTYKCACNYTVLYIERKKDYFVQGLGST